MAESKINFAEDAPSREVPKPDLLQNITSLARRQYKLMLEIEQLNASIEEKQKELNTLETVTLPERMKEAGMKSFELEGGFYIDVHEFIHASIPSNGAIEKSIGAEREALIRRKEACLKWLKKHKGDSLVKTKLTADFGKEKDDAAKKFYAAINKAGFPAKLDESVHPQSLNAFIREKIEQGVDVPDEAFALFRGNIAEIKQKKQKK